MNAISNAPESKARTAGRGRVPPPPKPQAVAQPPKAAGDARVPNREQAIAQSAYHMAERDGFPMGKDLEYWLTAEAEYERNLTKLKQ